MLQACVVQRVTSARELVFQLPDAVTASLGAIAAIPVRDEQDRIESCLDARIVSQAQSTPWQTHSLLVDTSALPIFHRSLAESRE
jgi:hypothetical protein